MSKNSPVKEIAPMLKWLRRLLPASKEPQVCCGDFARCLRPCVPRGEWKNIGRTDRALDALHTLYRETADYIERNNLGPVHHNRSMQDARDVLAAEGMTIWYDKPRGGTLGHAVRMARGGEAPPPPPQRFA